MNQSIVQSEVQVIAKTKESPMLFNQLMARALWLNQKTQTRRLMKRQPEWNLGPVQYIGSRFWDFKWAYVFDSGYVHTWDQNGIGGENWRTNEYPDESPYTEAFKRAVKQEFFDPPYWPGNSIWVRETWSPDARNAYPNYPKVYRADNPEYSEYTKKCRDKADLDEALRRPHDPPEGCLCQFRWKPSLHMPRRVARFLLDIKDVRIQRLQDISEHDALQEGVTISRDPMVSSWPYQGSVHPIKGNRKLFPTAIQAFADIWDSTVTKPELSWEGNPWVWAISFEKKVIG